MTTTYEKTRGYGGYFPIATRMRAHAREMLTGLEITSRNLVTSHPASTRVFVGPVEAEQVHDHAPGALASSRPSASLLVPALFALFACLGAPALSACPDASASLNVPALSACPNTSASLASLHVPASLARPGVPASLACPGVPASLARPGVPASLARPGVPASLNVPASAPVPALSACPHAPASSHHVGAGSNISCKAKQVCDRAPGRDGRQHGQDRQHLSTSVNGSFAGTYAEDGDGNSRASSFCLFST